MHRVVIVAFEGVQSLDVTGPAEVVAGANSDLGHHDVDGLRYDVSIASLDAVASIARRCGFGTAETPRRSLHRHLGVSPEAYRQRFSHRPRTATSQESA